MSVGSQSDVVLSKIEGGVNAQYTKLGRVGTKSFHIPELLVRGQHNTRVRRIVYFANKGGIWVSRLLFQHLDQFYVIVSFSPRMLLLMFLICLMSLVCVAADFMDRTPPLSSRLA